jgi:hypothetical protein
MDPVTMSAMLMGGSSLVSGLFSSVNSADTARENTSANIAAQQQAQLQTEGFNAGQAQINRDFSASQAGRQMDFQAGQVANQQQYQTAMSNTAYQRQMTDMRLAGLNPILAANSGGASVPSGGAASGASGSGSSASVGTPNMALHNAPGALSGLQHTVDNAVNSAINVKTFDKMTQEVANLRADEAKRVSENITERMKPSEIAARIGLETAETRNKKADLPVHELAGTSAQDIQHMPEWLRRSLNIGAFSGGKAADLLSPVLSTARSYMDYKIGSSRY